MGISKILKSLYAGALTGLTGVSSAYVAGNGHLGVVAVCTIASGVLTAVAVVWGVANATDETPPTPAVTE